MHFCCLCFGRLPMLPPHFFDDDTPDYRDIVDLFLFFNCAELIVFRYSEVQIFDQDIQQIFCSIGVAFPFMGAGLTEVCSYIPVHHQVFIQPGVKGLIEIPGFPLVEAVDSALPPMFQTSTQVFAAYIISTVRFWGYVVYVFSFHIFRK